MMKHKLIFLFAACVLFVNPGLNAGEEPGNPFAVQRLSDNVVVLAEGSPLENLIVGIASEKGIVVVDSTGSPYTAKFIRESLKKAFSRDDFAYVINTHHHWDHAMGNQVFPGAFIIGHERCLESFVTDAERVMQTAARMEQGARAMKAELAKMDEDSPEAEDIKRRIAFNMRNAKGRRDGYIPMPPSVTFNDRMTLDLGDLTIKLYYFGRAHSGSDIFIHVPEEGILITGDLFLEKGWLPLFSGMPVLDIPRWIDVMNMTLDGDDPVKYVIPGHREVWEREKLVFWRDYIVNLWNVLNEADRQGLDLKAAEARLPLNGGLDFLKKNGHTDLALQRFHSRTIMSFWSQLRTPAADILKPVFLESGVEAGIARYNELISKPNTEIFFDEQSFNSLGYLLLQRRKIEEAIAVFKLNIEAYPGSWNVYDSIAEAYMEMVWMSRPKLNLFLGAFPCSCRSHLHLTISLKRRIINP